MTKPKRQKRYGAEFKREDLRKAAEEGMTDKSPTESHPITASQRDFPKPDAHSG